MNCTLITYTVKMDNRLVPPMERHQKWRRTINLPFVPVIGMNLAGIYSDKNEYSKVESVTYDFLLGELLIVLSRPVVDDMGKDWVEVKI